MGSQQRADLEKAATYFTRLLAHSPENIGFKWLLNLTYMLSGDYPDGVPQKYLIPPALLATRGSADTASRFTDAANAAGLIRRGTAGELIVDDFDNDGFYDAVISRPGRLRISRVLP